MTHLEPQPPGVARPVPDAVSAPFWAAARRDVLAFQRCPACGWAGLGPAVGCPRCGAAALGWEESDGTGTIRSWTIAHRGPTPDFKVPYAPVVVDVDEGFSMFSSLIGCAVDEVRSGRRVRVEFHPGADGFRIPYFGLLLDADAGSTSAASASH